VAGDLCRTSFHNLLGGYDTRRAREWVHYEWSAGGNGAFAEDDGPSAMATIDWGDLVTVQSSEVMETRMPLIVESSRLAIDSGGAGTTRGGLSMQRMLRVLAPEARYSLLADGAIVPAFGVVGGLSGFPVGSWIDRNGLIEDFDTPGKVAGHPVEEGAAVVIRSAGGGGYGDPLLRDPERVATDVHEGYVSSNAAVRLYGVILKADGTIDAAATAALRQRIRDARFALTATAANESDVFESGAYSRRRICRLNPADAATGRFHEEEVVEFDTRLAAPLRAWVRIDPKVARGTVPLGERGIAILKTSAGARVELRSVATSVRPTVELMEAAE
jgi:N-methylhydantoinase B